MNDDKSLNTKIEYQLNLKSTTQGFDWVKQKLIKEMLEILHELHRKKRFFLAKIQNLIILSSVMSSMN